MLASISQSAAILRQDKYFPSGGFRWGNARGGERKKTSRAERQVEQQASSSTPPSFVAYSERNKTDIPYASKLSRKAGSAILQTYVRGHARDELQIATE
jgi:hypothetical protein